MAIILSVPTLFDNVVQRFSTELTDCPNYFGWQESAKQSGGTRRIVWIPGDPRGKLGDMLPPRSPGGNPRPLLNMLELVTCEIEASDTTTLHDERAQYQAARELFCAWMRAVHLAAFGTYTLLGVEWMVEKNQFRYGAGIRAVIGVQAVIPDLTFAFVAPAQMSSGITVDLTDVTETIVVTPA
ncbi:MAG: hypothetical protein H0X39_00500 [Actinobacteria bacterium]|nr:hypothetical protein [Actinomycetota bacterium]